MQAKMETAADKYRKLKEKRLQEAELIDFDSPSGMMWKLRRPDMALFITSGILPMTLAETVAKAMQKADGDNVAAMQNLEIRDQARMIEFTGKVIRYCAVDPKIVETPSAPNEIGFDEVELDDYNAIAKWAMGGMAGEGLNTFRSE